MKTTFNTDDLLNSVDDKINAAILANEYGVDKEIAYYLFKHMDNRDMYEVGLKRLKNGEPVQYIIGHVNFCGNKILVDNRVLIPKFETEELVEHTSKFIKENFGENLNILDIGTGSGCIAISIKKLFPNANVTAIDISKDALELAKENAKLNEVDINFIESDFLDSIEGKFDIIVSNPPYLKEVEEVMEIVKNNEPHLALYADNQGLAAYEKILRTISKNLNEKFLIAFEIGCNQAVDITALAVENLGTVQVKGMKDMQDRDRFLFIKSNQ